MPNWKPAPKRRFKCLDCGRESTWQHWWLPADYRCICGGLLMEVKDGKRE